ncbi:MAG: 2-keto-4-pentenoate hydratase [Actinomycetota bacterium]
MKGLSGAECESVVAAADRLREAVGTGSPCPPVRNLLPKGSIAHAYEVQALGHDRAVSLGGRIVGWKIGLTSEAVQRQLGVAQPDFGALFADAEVRDATTVAPGRLLQPRVEAEVAFVMAADLPERLITPVDVLGSVVFVAPAIEIVDSRIAGWDIDIVDTVSDNASSGLYVVAPRRLPLAQVDLAHVTMTLTEDGKTVSEGVGAACLGHPVNAVVWLANTLAALGRGLRAGDLVLSGALGPMADVVPGACYEALIDGLGSVSVAFARG